MYAVEGINVLRRPGKEVERLLSMFDKCTVYTIYNREDFYHLSIQHNHFNEKNNSNYLNQLSPLSSSSINDYINNAFTNVNCRSLNYLIQQKQQLHYQQQELSYSSSPTSSVDGSSSGSISPKHVQQYSNTKRDILTKHFQFFRILSRSYSNTLK